MTEGMQRRLATVVSADVACYSRLMGADEAGTRAAMKAHRPELWIPTIERFGGRVAGGAGDSILVEFADDGDHEVKNIAQAVRVWRRKPATSHWHMAALTAVVVFLVGVGSYS